MGQPAFASQGPPLPPWAPTSNPLAAVEPNLVVLASSVKTVFPFTLGPFRVPTEQYVGILFFINTTAFTGTSFTVQLQEVDWLSGAASNIAGAVTAAIAATGTYVMFIEPGAVEHLAVAAPGPTTVSFRIPDTWQLVVAGTMTSVTLSISALYVK